MGNINVVRNWPCEKSAFDISRLNERVGLEVASAALKRRDLQNVRDLQYWLVEKGLSGVYLTGLPWYAHLNGRSRKYLGAISLIAVGTEEKLDGANHLLQGRLGGETCLVNVKDNRSFLCDIHHVYENKNEGTDRYLLQPQRTLILSETDINLYMGPPNAFIRLNGKQ